MIENFKEKDLIIITIILYFVYEIMYHYGIFNNKLIQYLFAYIIPCFYLTMSAKWIFSTNKKDITIYIFLNLIICVCIGVYIYYKTGEFKNTNIMKYPFRIYYLSYGLCISSSLIMILKNKKICSILNTKLIKYISSNSLWIYLWHILFIYVYKILLPNINWILLFSLLIVSSCTIVFVQQKIISIMENKGVDKKLLSVFKG